MCFFTLGLHCVLIKTLGCSMLCGVTVCFMQRSMNSQTRPKWWHIVLSLCLHLQSYELKNTSRLYRKVLNVEVELWRLKRESLEVGHQISLIVNQLTSIMSCLLRAGASHQQSSSWTEGTIWPRFPFAHLELNSVFQSNTAPKCGTTIKQETAARQMSQIVNNIIPLLFLLLCCKCTNDKKIITLQLYCVHWGGSSQTSLNS